MSLSAGDPLLDIVSFVALLAAVGLSVVVLGRYSDREAPFRPLRERFVFGIPWGTLVVVGLVYAFYYLVQGGGADGGPVTTAFRSWSLFYPFGLVFSSFAHANESHLIGNLLGTVAFAPIVEFAWGHYAPEDAPSTGSWLERPAGRITAFVGLVFLAGLAGSLFVPGAVIGFSGVVFALAGFALVARPVLTVFAILGVQVLRLFRSALLDPVVTATARPRFVSPSWADIALQGHLFGMLLGVLLAVALLRIRDERPELLYIWFAALVFAVMRTMYAIYWYLGADSFVLYRGLGTAGVFLLATVVGLAVYADRTPVSRLRVSSGQVAVVCIVLLVGMVAVSGLAYNVSGVSPGPDVEEGMTVGDYRVAYVEDVEDRYISSVTLPLVGGLSAEVSGVVVASDRRNAWELARSKQRLAFDGAATIPVGGATWRDTVYLNRTAWAVLGGNTTYKVYGSHASANTDRELLFAADPAQAALTLNHSRVRIAPTTEFYEIVVTRNGSELAAGPIPAAGSNVTLANITFAREGRELFARHDGTAVRLAEFKLRAER